MPPFFNHRRGKSSLFNIISGYGLATNLELCLDAGDSASYAGSGQSWLDRSGNGFDFFRGTTSAAQSTDPTFNGSAGGLSSSEYWSFDGTQFFRYDSTNEAWMQNLHKNNAIFTFLAWAYLGSTNFNGLFGQRGVSGGSNTGFSFHTATGGFLKLLVENAGSSVIDVTSSISASASTWSMLALSVNEGAASGTFVIDADSETFDSTYTSPASGNASFTIEVAARGNANLPMVNDSRMAMFAAWEGTALTAAELNTIYGATRSRFGT